MKVYIQTTTGTGEEAVKTEKEVADLKTAEQTKKAGEKIHICYHDETPFKPCRLI